MTDRFFVVWGAGNLGRFFGGAALKAGYVVMPVLRASDPEAVFSRVPAGTPIFIGVGESDLDAVLEAIPEGRREDLILVQNQLTPQWLRERSLDAVTVAVVWTNVKTGLPITVGRPTGLHGPHADLMRALHEVLQVPCDVYETTEERDLALAAKAGFILTVNALGVAEARTVGEWLETAPLTVESTLEDATGITLLDYPGMDPKVLRDRICDGLKHFPSLPSRGRTARARLEAALRRAESAGIEVPHLSEHARGGGDG